MRRKTYLMPKTQATIIIINQDNTKLPDQVLRVAPSKLINYLKVKII